MITQELADYLINLEKNIIENDEILDNKIYSPEFPVNDRIDLISRENDEYTFFVDIKQRKKNYLKITLHLQEIEASIGLLRIDYNGRHLNPAIVNSNVPSLFVPYAGQWIEGDHIHYYIDGYKPLSWAIPISIDKTVNIKEYKDSSEICNILKGFFYRINLKTTLDINIQTNLL